jgi:DNA-binding LytR/AlgR family response regulator
MKNNSEVKTSGVLALKELGKQGMKTDNLERKLLRFHEIHYIITAEVKNNLCIGTDEKGKEYYLCSSLKTIAEKLPSIFLQISQSYIVNVDEIEGKNNKIICMKHRDFTIGTTHKKKVNNFFDNGFLK